VMNHACAGQLEHATLCEDGYGARDRGAGLCCPRQVHYILDEMLINGQVVDTNRTNILEPVQLLEQVQI
jgi:hypothetical protein